jgi:site-specific recombinase XerD
VSQILGHKTLAMSARYAHLHTDNLRQALETMTSRLFSCQ